MRVESRVALGSAAFLILAFIVYLAWSREATGSACLLFGGVAYGMMGGYMYLQHVKRGKVPRPEDSVDATQADGAGEVGFFPAASMWPAGIGVGAVFFGVAMIWGSWYWLIGGIMLFGAVIGFVVESENREDGPDDPGTMHPSADVLATTPQERVEEIARWTEEPKAAHAHPIMRSTDAGS
jgi:hypothetical protein